MEGETTPCIILKNNLAMKIIDLNHLLNNETTVYPGAVKTSFKATGTVAKDGYSEHELTMGTHTGTHIDAPGHMLLNGKTLDQIHLSKFVGKATVIRCEGKTEIELSYLKNFKTQISKVDFVLFNTGWDKKWKDPDYIGDYPTLKPEAAEWLTQFNLNGLGFDTISVDPVSDKKQTNHHILFNRGLLIVENLTNLNQLPGSIFTFQCIPLKIENADGSPIRAVAILEE